MRDVLVQILWVGAGGFFGSSARFLAAMGVHHALGRPGFPFGTLGVNLAGCALIGILNGVADARGLFPVEVRLFLLLGFLGGFTTFSSFAYETMVLGRQLHTLYAVVNVLLQVMGGLLAVAAGYALARAVC